MYCVVARNSQVEIYSQGFYSDSYKNVIPGTVLSEGITSASADLREYFLVSTSQRQGFASPSKYTVLYDSTEEPLQKLHLLSYKLCHSYFNIANPVNSPSPIFYARKLAKWMAERSKVVSFDTQSAFPMLPSTGYEANYSSGAAASQGMPSQKIKIEPIRIHPNFLGTMPNLFFL